MCTDVVGFDGSEPAPYRHATMGADLYRVTVVSKKATTAVFDIKVIHPDISTIPEDPSFALMFLRQATDTSPLASEVTNADVTDKAWVKKYASGFIESVALKLSGTTGKRGRLTVSVFEPAWLQHVEKGESFDTAAFQLLKKYDRHPPILMKKGEGPPPAAVDDAALDAAEGFLWVPREVYGHLEYVKPLPPFIQLPAYSLSAYEVVDEMSGKIDQKRLQAWVGKAVRVMVSGKAREGALGIATGLHDPIALLSLRGYGSSKIDAIGRLRLKPGRRGTKLSYAEVFEDVRTSVTGVKKKGATLELTCRMFPDGRKAPFASESDVLALLARPLKFEFSREGFKTRAPLATALERDLRDLALGYEEELYPAVARAYIASFSIEGETRPKKKLTAEKLDALAPPAALAALSADWPTFTLKIEVTDPKYIAHVDDKLPMFADNTVLPKAAKQPAKKPEPEPPAPSKGPPKRVVLWLMKGTSNKVWIATQDGARWTAQYGRRVMPRLDEKVYELASEEKASAAFAKAVEAKKREGYRVAPTYEEAAKVLWKRLGLAFDDASGKLVVTKIGKPASNSTHFEEGFRASDTVSNARLRRVVHAVWLRTIEELAVVVESGKAGDAILLDTARKSGMSTIAAIDLR